MSKRGSNFSKSEEHCLISLIKKHKDLIECKKSNAVTWKDKENSWKLIESEFNSIAINGPRNIKTLKEKYQNLKKKTKAKFAENKLNILKTGGGSYNPVPVDDIDMAIKEMIGEQLDGIQNTYETDSDCQRQVLPASTNDESDVLIDDHSYGIEDPIEDEITYELVTDIPEDNSLNMDQIQENVEHISDWSSYCGADLKRPVTTNLAVKNGIQQNTRKPIITRKNMLRKKYVSLNSQLIQEKLDFVRIQKEKFLEEHRLKMNILEKDCELKSKQSSNY